MNKRFILGLLITVVFFLLIVSCQDPKSLNNSKTSKIIGLSLDRFTSDLKLNKEQKEKLKTLKEEVTNDIIVRQIVLKEIFQNIETDLNNPNSDLKTALTSLDKTDSIYTEARIKNLESFYKFYDSLNEKQKITVNHRILFYIKYSIKWISY